MTDEELKSLLEDLESETVERKESFKGDTPRRARETVCAFMNDLSNNNKPGILFVGAKDNGEASGIDISDELIRTLSDMKTDGNIIPLPVLSVEKRSIKGTDMAVVTVMPSDMPPVRYQGRIWIRTGSRRSVANAQDERILNEKRRHKNHPFDLYPISSSTLSDLSKTIFENQYLPNAFAADILEANERSYEETLRSCRMTAPLENTPTVMGLLCIGKSPQDYLPGAYIQFLRIDGTELTDPVVDEEVITGTVVNILERTKEKLKAHNTTAVDVLSSATHQIFQPYPLPAILQILYNAVHHRSYEGTNTPIRVNWFNDRIEITSPGGPYGVVTPENFGTGVTDYRNPNIGAALKTFGFVQSFGRGISIARNQLQQNGNPDLEFEVNQSMINCTIRGIP